MNDPKKIVQKIVLGGVVMRDGKMLILQRSRNEDVYPGIWEFPGGKREPLESSENSLLREIKEETSLNVKLIMPFSVFDYQIEKPGEIRDSTQINFLVAPIGDGKITLSEEHQAFAWITSKEIDEYNFTEETKNVIKKAFEITPITKW